MIFPFFYETFSYQLYIQVLFFGYYAAKRYSNIFLFFLLSYSVWLKVAIKDCGLFIR